MKTLLLASSALLGLALPTLACAQGVASNTVDTVIVTASPDPEDPPVVAGARKRLSETPGAVSVISAESYAKREALALDDMLRDAPGVYAQRKWGGDIRISIRGSGIGNANHNRGLILAQEEFAGDVDQVQPAGLDDLDVGIDAGEPLGQLGDAERRERGGAA